ncbi:MAG: uroporphyrinogen-III synthase [Capnocytophaga sp.]|nr:uroporphyrinogen-III synthase [Capnocytophaga sp.]
MPLILSTKILTPTQRQYLLNAGLQVMEADFISVKIIPFDLPEYPSDRLIFTSQNAVQSVLQHPENQNLKKIPVLCVGDKTAALLQQSGWHVAHTEPYAADLGNYIAENCPQHRFLFFTGNLRSEQIPKIFRTNQIEYKEIQTYHTKLTPHRIETTPDAILFYSPSGVESYLKINSLSSEQLFCIGNVTAKAVSAYSSRVITALHPTVENVIIRCIKHFQE